MNENRDYTVMYYYDKSGIPTVMRHIHERMVFEGLSLVIAQVVFNNHHRAQLLVRVEITKNDKPFIEYEFEYYEREKYGLLPPVKRIRRIS